jgi:thiol-disulfide isomerase/thioredoxin
MYLKRPPYLSVGFGLWLMGTTLLSVASVRAESDSSTNLSILMEVYVYQPDNFQPKKVTQLSLVESLGSRKPDTPYWFVRPLESLGQTFDPGKWELIAAWLKQESVPGLVLDGHPEIGDAEVALLRPLQEITLLSLRQTGVTDKAVRSLERFKALHYLDVSETAVTEQRLAVLKKSGKVVSLPIDWFSPKASAKKAEPSSASSSFWLGLSPAEGIHGQLPRGKYPADYTLKLKTLQGQEVSLDSMKGKVIFLNFWATYCGPCRSEIPSLESLYMTLENQDVFFAYVTSEPAALVQAFLEKDKRHLPVYIADKSTTGPYMAEGIPATYIISKKGDWVVRRLGADKWDTQEVIEYIFKLMKE